MHLAKIMGALVALSFCAPSTSHAGEAGLPITVTLIKCGDYKSDLPKACERDDRCCVFMDQTVVASYERSVPQPALMTLPPEKAEALRKTAPRYRQYYWE